MEVEKDCAFFRTLLARGRTRVSPKTNIAYNTVLGAIVEPQGEGFHMLKTIIEKRTLQSAAQVLLAS